MERVNSKPGVLSDVWRAAGPAYLLLCLAGLAVGIWVDDLFIRRGAFGAPLPTLKTLAISQIAFALLVWPLIAMRRGRRGGYWARGSAELAAYLLAGAPFCLAAGYMGDASLADVLRVELYVAAVWTVGLSAGACLIAGGSRASAAMMSLLVVAIGLPAGFYIASEFLTHGPADLLWLLAPATFAWEIASPSHGPWWVGPIWPILIWPILSATGACANLLLCGCSEPAK